MACSKPRPTVGSRHAGLEIECFLGVRRNFGGSFSLMIFETFCDVACDAPFEFPVSPLPVRELQWRYFIFVSPCDVAIISHVTGHRKPKRKARTQGFGVEFSLEAFREGGCVFDPSLIDFFMFCCCFFVRGRGIGPTLRYGPFASTPHGFFASLSCVASLLFSTFGRVVFYPLCGFWRMVFHQCASTG